MTRRKRIFLLVFPCLVMACGGRVATDVIATYSGGALHREEIEKVLSLATRTGTPEETSELIRDYSRNEVVRRIVLARDERAKMLDPERRRELLTDLYISSQSDLRFQISDLELSQAYEEDSATFSQPEKANVYHLFRKHDDPSKPQTTLDRLAAERSRILDGTVSFSQVAKEISHSETRSLGGRLGWIGRGKLPSRLDSIVFSLGPGEVSDPILVSGGAILLHVEEKQNYRHFSLEEVRPYLRARLAGDRSRTLLDEHVADVVPPDGSLVVAPDELQGWLDENRGDAVVLRIGDVVLTGTGLVESVQERVDRHAAPWPADRSWLLIDTYERIRQRALAYLKAERSGFALLPEVEARLSRGVQAELDREYLDTFFDEEMARIAAMETDRLRSFFDDHRHLYQTELEVRLRSLSLPLGPHPTARLQELDQLSLDLQLGVKTLEEAAEAIGGQIKDYGWLSPSGLKQLEGKVRWLVLSLQGPGTTVPFQLNRSLAVVSVDDWLAPKQLAYEAVSDRVLADFVEQHQQVLFRQVVDEKLNEAGFRLYEDHLQKMVESDRSSVPAT